jgi:hypothetical protein
MTNSDHANFAQVGIPAFRLVAGFDEVDANLRFVLTAHDRRDKVAEGDLKRATRLAAAIVNAACETSEAEAAIWRDAIP